MAEELYKHTLTIPVENISEYMPFKETTSETVAQFVASTIEYAARQSYGLEHAPCDPYIIKVSDHKIKEVNRRRHYLVVLMFTKREHEAILNATNKWGGKNYYKFIMDICLPNYLAHCADSHRRARLARTAVPRELSNLCFH